MAEWLRSLTSVLLIIRSSHRCGFAPRSGHESHVGQATFCLRVCQVVFPRVLRFSHHLPIDPSRYGTRAYLKTDTDEMPVVYAHLNDLSVKFSGCVSEGQDKLPTMYWLSKLYKRPYKEVQVGKDQEKAQSEKDSHSKNRGGKSQTNNQVYHETYRKPNEQLFSQ